MPDVRERPRIWPDIAKDMVLASVDKGPGKGTRTTLAEVSAEYGLDDGDLRFLMGNEAFRGLVRAQFRRVRSLGDKAVFQFKTEEMAMRLAEVLFQRLISEAAPIGEVRAGLELFTRASGLDRVPEAARAQGPAAGGVNIQINLPDLEGGRLGHVRGLPDAAGPG
jgi:hypothetical protein